MLVAADKFGVLFVLTLFGGTLFINSIGHAELSWHLKWCWLMGCSLALLLSQLGRTQNGFYVPRLDRMGSVFAIAAGLGFLISLSTHWPQVSVVRLGERVCYFVLFFYFLRIKADQGTSTYHRLAWTYGFLFASLIFLALTNWTEIAGDRSRRALFPLFSNRNMFTEALLLTAILFLLSLDSLTESFQKKAFFAVGIAFLSSAVTFHVYSRSAMIVSAAMMGMTLMILLSRNFKGLIRTAFGISLVGALSIPLWHLKFADPSVTVRWYLLDSAVSILRSHPTGVGIGNFPWAELALPTSISRISQLMFKSPHNEFLRLACEEGLLTATGTYGFLFWWLWLAQKTIQSPFRLLGYLSFLAFFVVETSFQFPFENPFPALGMAAAFASLETDKTDFIEFKPLVKVLILFLVFILSLGLLYKVQFLRI